MQKGIRNSLKISTHPESRSSPITEFIKNLILRVEYFTDSDRIEGLRCIPIPVLFFNYFRGIESLETSSWKYTRSYSMKVGCKTNVRLRIRRFESLKKARGPKYLPVKHFPYPSCSYVKTSRGFTASGEARVSPYHSSRAAGTGEAGTGIRGHWTWTWTATWTWTWMHLNSNLSFQRIQRNQCRT